MAALLPAAAPLAMAASGVQAVGALASGRAAQQAGDATYQANLQAAQSQRDAAAANAWSLRDRARAARGKQAAAAGAEGLTLTGSVLDVMSEGMAQAEKNAQTLLSQGQIAADRTAWQGRMAKAQGDAAMTGSLLSATGSLLSGAAKAGTYS